MASTTQITNAGIYLSTMQPAFVGYNGTGYLTPFATGVGGTHFTGYSEDPTVSWNDETAYDPTAFGSYNHKTTVVDSNGRFYAFSSAETVNSIALGRRDAGSNPVTAWIDGSPIDVATGNIFRAFFAATIDENDNLFVVYWDGVSTSLTMRYSTDFGATWNTGAAPASGLFATASRCQFGAKCDGSGALHVVYRKASDAKPYREIFTDTANPGAGSFAAATKLSDRIIRSNRNDGMWIGLKRSTGEAFVSFVDNSTRDYYLIEETSGTWSDVGNIPFAAASITAVMNSNDEIVFMDTSAVGDIEIGNNAGFTTFAGIFVGYFGEFAPYVYPSAPTVNYFNIATDGLEAVYAEDSTWETPGGDTNPPTGGGLTAPTDEAEGVSLVPVVSVAGWEDDTTPISSYVQIDTVNTFDSANLQESGWFVLSDEGGGEWGGSYSGWSALQPNTLHYIRDRARDAVDPPNISEYNTTQTFTTGWKWSGITQPSIIYNGITVSFPVPVSCQILPGSISKENVAIDGGSIEFIDQGAPKIMKVRIPAHYSIAFESAMDTFFRDWGGQKKWFDFTSGQDVRNDGDWLLQDDQMKPKITSGLRMYELTFWRPYS